MGRSRLFGRHKQRAAPTVSLTPLIDTALTLLVVFMVAAPVAHHSIRVDLPRGLAAQEQKKKITELVVTINQQEQIFCNGDIIVRPELSKVLAQRIQSLGAPVHVYLSVDRRAAAGVAVEVLSILRSLEGVQCVAFDVDVREAPSL